MASYITLLLASFSWMVMTRFLIFGSLHTTENIDNGCPCNWKTFQNHCYKVFLENKSWDDANEHCKFHGSHLAVINSKAENDLISSMTSLKAWIGFQLMSGAWKTADDFSYNFSAWNTSVLGYINSSKWNTAQCSHNYSFICEKNLIVCQENEGICGNHSKCINSNGSYYCTCQDGFSSKSGKNRFTNASSSDCNDINECKEYNQTCGNYSICTNTNGSYYCTCQKGFRSTSGEHTFTDSKYFCNDINECTEYNQTCGNYSICTNTNGSYYCTCQKGFRTTSGEHTFTDSKYFCNDINECTESNQTCGNNSICTNTKGSYYCTCQNGFRLTSGEHTFTDSKSSFCNDTDECSENKTICGNHSNCTNTIGSFNCKCHLGYRALSTEDASSSVCSGMSCQCCLESQDPGNRQCSYGNLQLNNETQGLINDIATLNFNDTHTEEKKAEAVTKIAIFLKKTEESVFENVISRLALGTNETKEKKINFHTKNTDIVAQALPLTSLNNTKIEHTLYLATGNITMAINIEELINGTEPGKTPVAILMVYHSSGIESILSAGNETDNDSPYKYMVHSKIISAKTSSKRKNNFIHPIIFTFEVKKVEEDNEGELKCAFLETDGNNKSKWSTEGCSLYTVDSNKTNVTCHCTHLSSFAVLLALTDIDNRPLTVISYIGLTFSIICLVFTILTFWKCRSAKNAGTPLLLNLCACLLVADIIFIFGISQTKNEILCKVIAAFLHYFFLASFFWMYLGALQLHLMVQNLKAVKAFKSHIIPGKFMHPVGYGIPAIIVMVSACVYPGGYGTQNACWLSLKQEFRWSFIGPVCFVIAINLILFIITIGMLREKLSSVNKDVSTINNTRVLLFKAVSQFLVLGCTWILGIFQIQKTALVMAYIFTILNSFHGVFMFLLYCLSNKLVVDEYRTWLRKQFSKIKKGREFEISTTTAATVSTWTSQSGEEHAMQKFEKKSTTAAWEKLE